MSSGSDSGNGSGKGSGSGSENGCGSGSGNGSGSASGSASWSVSESGSGNDSGSGPQGASGMMCSLCTHVFIPPCCLSTPCFSLRDWILKDSFKNLLKPPETYFQNSSC